MLKKTLSQKEIDGLLAEATDDVGGKVIEFDDSKVVKLYDFKRPDKFSKEQMRTLSMLHEGFARMLASSLSGYLRMGAKVNIVSVEQNTFEEYVHQVHAGSILALVSIQPLVGSVIFEVDATLAFAVVDRLLGGSGKVIQKVRTVTDIEQALVNRMLTYGAEGLKESWKHIVDINPVIEEIIASSQFTRLAIPSEVTVVISFEVRLLDVTGKISICIPYSVLEPVVPKLSAPVWLTEWKNADTNYKALLVRQLSRVMVCLNAELGSADVTLGDIAHLEKGDVVRLGSRAGQSINVKVEGRVRYRAKPGLVGSKFGIQIISVEEEDAEAE
ncbi:MAG: flagellar motor switch protein FliM [Chloroflexota bacterium]